MPVPAPTRDGPLRDTLHRDATEPHRARRDATEPQRARRDTVERGPASRERFARRSSSDGPRAPFRAPDIAAPEAAWPRVRPSH